MNRYCLDVPTEDEDVEAQRILRQRHVLDRWEVVLEDGLDPRLGLCEALLHGDENEFGVAFEAVADAREARVLEQIDKRELVDEDAAWVLPWWGEGLALLRLAEHDGLRTDGHYKMVPQLTRGPGPFAYDAMAWATLDYRPTRRSI